MEIFRKQLPRTLESIYNFVLTTPEVGDSCSYFTGDKMESEVYMSSSRSQSYKIAGHTSSITLSFTPHKAIFKKMFLINSQCQ
jgi:hypothetical protein